MLEARSFHDNSYDDARIHGVYYTLTEKKVFIYIIYKYFYAGITAKKEIIVTAKRLSFLPSLITVMT